MCKIANFMNLKVEPHVCAERRVDSVEFHVTFYQNNVSTLKFIQSRVFDIFHSIQKRFKIDLVILFKCYGQESTVWKFMDELLPYSCEFIIEIKIFYAVY